MPEQIYINGNTYTLGATVGPISGTGGSTNYFFGNLNYGTTYSFVVVAYNYAGFSGYAGPVTIHTLAESRQPIFAFAFSWPYDWMSSGGVFTQSTGNKNLLAYSNDLTVSGTNYPTDDLNTGTAGCWNRIDIASVEKGFSDPFGGTGASKITLTNVPGNYSRLFQIQQEVKPNTVYTYSFWTNTTLTGNNFSYAIYNTTINPNAGYVYIDGGPIDVSANNGWIKTTKTFTTGLSQYGVAIYSLNKDNSDGSIAYLWGPQLEEGYTSTSFEITKGFKEFSSGAFNDVGQRTYIPDFNLWSNYASSIGATYLSPMVRAPFGRNTSRNLSTFMDGWTLSYIMKLSAQQLASLPVGLKVISSNNFDYHEMLYHENDRITVAGVTGFKFIDDGLIYGKEDGYYPGAWNDAGISLYKKYWTDMIDALYDYGASVDQIHQDNEDNKSIMWAMDLNGAKTNIAMAYVDDPRFKQSWRGLTSWENAMANYGATVSQIFNYNSTSGLTHYTVWNYMSSKITSKVFDEIWYQTTKLRNPNVIVSNYNYFTTDAATTTGIITEGPPDPGGHPMFVDSVVGNASAPYLYGEISQSIAGTGGNVAWKVRPSEPTILNRYNPVDGVMLSTVNPTRWTRIILTLQTIRAIKRASPQGILTPWISSVNYSQGYIQNISGVPGETLQSKQDFYYEAIRHMGVSGVKHFLWWNDGSIYRTNSGQSITQSDFNNLSDVLGEINTRIGGSTPTAMVTERISWFSDYLISGAPGASGGYWWRVTPKPGKTITVNGTTTIDSSSEVGSWIYTETSDVPSITVLAPG